MILQARLSQKTAILLEHARKCQISDEALLACVAASDISELAAAKSEQYGYDTFITYATEHHEDLASAIRDGYRITFNTFRGLQVWLHEKFDITEGTDFDATEGRLTGIKLSRVDAEVLEARLAPNWVLKRNEDTIDLTVRGL
ncbi:hypothetical protein NV379_24460 [Paenibacillus sp. N1-5-1-14]|uniref:hypothetical protein n=1 Tax=Paenibacillus radicibacter TaxID=2972488 RepID=UPI002158BEC9|nr:hypothetical protein [Paenibacillus radicibacter]MCR8645798.1 hypothetical protein [Paenibacillus radicibacter]